MNPTHAGFKLYAQPTFCEGVARLLDFTGLLNKYNYSNSEEQADIRAMRSDWENVGIDIKIAMEQFDKEIHGQINQ